jgi:hypothetical protein
MAFHVEISSGLRHRARAFNLDEAKLRTTILDPWIRGRRIALGDKDWEPKDCTLVILEGPELVDTDLSMGRGWSNAERTAENVTRRLVDAAATPAKPTIAILAEAESSRVAIERMLERLELGVTTWADLRSKILGPPNAPPGPGFAAVLAVEGAEPSPTWLFDAGLARGALGGRAVVIQLGDAAIPPQFTGVDVIRLDPDDETSLRALGDRLTR